jgi:hypothetical protein
MAARSERLARLGGDSYDERSATFTVADGDSRHCVATDCLQTPQLSVLGCDRVLALATREDLRFDRRRRVGAVIHMLCSIDELGRAGFTAIGRSAAEADAIFEHVQATLVRQAQTYEASSRIRRPAAARLALGIAVTQTMPLA